MESESKKDQTPVVMLNPYKVWKKLYYCAGDTLTNTVKESVNTGEFASHIDFILNSCLLFLKMQNDFIGKYMENSPFSSKQDVAQVADLVVSFEKKLAVLEEELKEKLTSIQSNTQLSAHEFSDQQPFPSGDELNTALSPTIAAVKDLSKRISDLEKMLKRVDATLVEIKKATDAEPKKKAVEVSQSPKVPKSKLTDKAIE